MLKSFEIDSPNLVKQIGPGIGFPGIPGQQYQHIKLLGRELMLLVIGFHNPFGDIQVEVFKLDNLPWSGRLALSGPSPSQDCFYPRHQLPEAEGLGHVIVGPDLQSQHLVNFLRLGGKHDDGGINFFHAKLLANLQIRPCPAASDRG